MDNGLLAGVILLSGLFLLARSKGPSAGLLLADVLVVSAIGYSAGARIACFLYRSICVAPVVELADLVTVSTLLAGILISLLVATRPQLLGHLHRWTDMPKRCRWRRAEQRLHFALALSGVAVSFAFLYAVHTASNGGLVSLLRGETSLLEVRKGIVSGAYGYLAPGYLRQIRDVLFPIVAGAFMMFGIPRRYRVVFWISTVIVVAAMLVSGQRTPLVMLFAVMGLSLYSSVRRAFTGLAVPIAVTVAVAAGLFLVSTAWLGRNGVGQTLTERVAAMPLDIAERVFVRTPYENMVTADFWRNSAPTFGQSWLDDLSAVLPGTQPMMSTRLHVELGGSAAGNSVLGLPADLYLSWSWLGAVIFPWLYMFGALAIDRYCALSRSAFTKSLKIYLTLSAVQWYSPYLFVLNGGLILLAVVALDYVRRSMPRRV